MKQNQVEVDLMNDKKKLRMMKTYGADQEHIPMGHGKIEIAGVVLQPDDVMKLNKIIDG